MYLKGQVINFHSIYVIFCPFFIFQVAQVLTFDDILNEEPKTKTINATSCGIPGSEKQPKRGQTIKKSDFSKNSSMKNSDKSGGFLTNQANNTSDTSSKKINHTYR